METNSTLSIYKISYPRSMTSLQTNIYSTKNSSEITSETMKKRHKFGDNYLKPYSTKSRTKSLPKMKILNEIPKVTPIKKNITHLGIVKMDPNEYIQKYGKDNLLKSTELPQFVKEIQPPLGIELAANKIKPQVNELYGDVFALDFVDLEKEGLNEYNNRKKSVKKSASSDLTCGLCGLISAISSSNSNKQKSVLNKKKIWIF